VPQQYLELQRHRIVLMYQVLQEHRFLPVLYFLVEFLGRQAVGHLEIGELARTAAEALPLEVVFLPLEEALPPGVVLLPLEEASPAVG
jgi:hypothetical protein